MTDRATPSRSSRLVRGWSLASIATFAGVVSHVLAMGHAPAPSLVAVCWALSGLVCVLLSGIRRSALATALSVVSSQGILHWLFAQAGQGAVMRQADGHAMTGHAGHMMHGSGTLSASVQAQSASPSMTMIALHLVAALLTYLAVRRGDAAVAALSLALRMGLLWVAPSWPRIRVVPARRPEPIFRVVGILVHKVYPGPVPLRGPPLSLASA